MRHINALGRRVGDSNKACQCAYIRLLDKLCLVTSPPITGGTR